MDNSKIKGVLQKLSIFKDYSSLLVSVGIILVAGVIFGVSIIMGNNLNKQIADDSISSLGQRVSSLKNSAVPRSQVEEEEKYQKEYGKDANAISLLAKQTTQRELLNYKIFPKPKDTSMLIFDGFGQQYRNKIDELIMGINGRTCPTNAEIEKGLQGSNVSPTSRRGSAGVKSYTEQNEIQTALKDVLCREKAESSLCYANSSDLSGYEYWLQYKNSAGMNDAIKDSWYWQLGYWIIEDVINTVGQMNAGSKNVYTSPVKRLSSISFSPGGIVVSTKADKSDGNDIRPRYILKIEDGLVLPCTGRICNNDNDVVHFIVSVVVDTKSIMPLMQKLCSEKEHKFKGFSGDEQEQTFKHNQITILDYAIDVVNREDQEHNLYRYGEEPVVKLTLTCEYIFNKKAYDEIKPDVIKEPAKEAEK